jgi:protein SCO1
MRTRSFVGAVLGLMALLVAVAFFAIAQPVRVLPRMALAPGYTLLDQQGARLTSEDLRGAIVLYTFASSGCGEACEAVHRTMREVRDRLREIDTGGVPVRLVTVTLDPAHDTPATLADRAAALGVDGEVWRYATGDGATIKQVVGGGFEVFYQPRPEGGVRFDPTFVLVDGWGIMRARHRVGMPAAETLADQIRLLGSEIRASTGVARYAYEAAHLFSCYAY